MGLMTVSRRLTFSAVPVIEQAEPFASLLIAVLTGPPTTAVGVISVELRRADLYSVRHLLLQVRYHNGTASSFCLHSSLNLSLL